MTYEFPDYGGCDFCDYIEGRLPWEPVEEGAEVVAFMNLRQRSAGSLLVAPRRHVSSVLDLSRDESAQLMLSLRALAGAIRAAFDPDGLHVWWGTGIAAGQSEPHMHAQMVPRYTGSEYSFVASEDLPVTPVEERLALAEAIRRHLPRPDPKSGIRRPQEVGT